MKIRKCPKCRGIPSYYTEIWDKALGFKSDENGFPEKEGSPGGYGSSDQVIATCGQCGNNWRLTKIRDMDDLRKWMKS